MNNYEKEEHLQYFIVDSTAIIHHFVFEREIKDNEVLLIPEKLEDEIMSFQAKSTLELLKEESKIIFTRPTEKSLIEIKKHAKKTGDISALSTIDLQVLSLALDYPHSVILSDDNAIQNICRKLNIKFKPFQFKIKHFREYFWKCSVCGSKFTQKMEKCPDCGSPTKRYYSKKK